MFKVAGINRQTAEAAEMENGKKSQVEYHLRYKAVLPILECLVNELENNVGWQTSKELETLLWEHPVPTICRGRHGRGEYSCPWTESNQIELNALRNAPIKMANISMDASWCNIRWMWSGHTRRCLAMRKWTSSRRWRRSTTTRRVQMMGDSRHLASLPFS
jgi:hypothetical protein